MKRLTTEIVYLLNRVIFGVLFVPGILWSVSELFTRYLTGGVNASLTVYYQQFYGHIDKPVTWLWLASPYLVFLLVRPRTSARCKQLQRGSGKAAGRGRSAAGKPQNEGSTSTHDVNATVRRETPLQLAAMTDNMDIVRMLVDGGAEIDIASHVDGFRPLHNSAVNGCTNVCEYLLRHGADMDAQTDQGDTALHLAAANQHSDIVALLLSFHADHSLKNNAGFTAEQIAAARDNSPIVELIQQHARNEWPYARLLNSSGG